MNRGKYTCKILKEIRKKIAEENDIEYITSECHFLNDCLGTCPKCEAELLYLGQELERKIRLGKTVFIAGLSVGLLSSFSGCKNKSAVSEREPVDRGSNHTDIDYRHNDSLSNLNFSEPMPVNALPGFIGDMSCNDEEKVVHYSFGESTSDFSDEQILTNDPKKEFMIELVDGKIELFDDEIVNGEDSNFIYRYVETIPEFSGGTDSMYSFLKAQLRYPVMAQTNKIQGTVLAEFVIEKDGTIGNVKILISLSPDCDEEALRVIKLMPKWNPGKQLGKPVRSYYTLPVRFLLE